MIDVRVGEVVSSIRAFDSEQLLSPALLARIVSEVMRAIDDQRDHRERVASERRVTGSVRDALDREA